MVEQFRNTKKFLWNVLDRVMFIGIGVIGTVATSYITGVMKLNPPELMARPIYSRIDSQRPVPKSVGGLQLNYEEEAPRSYGVLRVDIANEGRGPADDVRFQVKFTKGLTPSYEIEPDFKVYSPSSIALKTNEFYAELGHFPSGANDFVALRIDGDVENLNLTRIKLANNEYEGKVSPIGGLR